MVMIEQNEKHKENFVASVVHDLKSPTFSQLAAINMFLNGKLGKLNRRQKEMAQLMKGSNQYLTELIATIMDTYKFENGQMSLKPKEFDITNTLKEVIKNTDCILLEREQKIAVVNNLSSNKITADPLQIKRVITNLITNAATYSKNKSVIEILMSSDNSTLELNVLNEPKFRPTKDLNKLFEKFQTDENAQYNKASTGLGLYLSKNLIELHNGEIYARQENSGKCLFGFKIPVNQK